ncbi:putative secreted protein [Sorangium cellulosum So ce56]|uniref:Secreted protein n=1 Tax=Sorangium cellulosum (strain So ce56) TaxID=448385 RepID=A9G167_SORC5|nr:SIMPL domain-containing protein [Sorangium cellulosum]CAN92478.1 putative secreted protein [Sorangium cellulosum So ce56]
MKNQRSLSRAYLAGLMLSVTPLLAACAAQATPPVAAAPEVNTITVVGRGDVSARPDVARAQMGIEVMAPTVHEATKLAAARMTEILAALKNAGLAEKDIQTSNYSIQLVRQPDVPPWMAMGHAQPAPAVAPAPAAPAAAPAAPAGRGPKAPQPPAPKPPPADLAPAAPPPPTHVYQVSNTVMVVIRKLDQVGAVLDAAVAAGANNVWGVSFGLDQTDPLEARAREKAIADARARAEALAKLQGVSLGPVVSISEVVEHGPVYAPRAALASGGYSADMGTPVSSGEVPFGTQVKVVYALERAPAGPRK